MGWGEGDLGQGKGVVRKDEGNEWRKESKIRYDERSEQGTGGMNGKEGRRERAMEGKREHNQGTKKVGFKEVRE